MTGAEFHGVDIDLLADYVGGALDGTPEADRVAALIAGDPAWREAFEVLAPEMATVGALLGDLPAEPMPDDVVARLGAALSAFPAGGAVTDAVPREPAEPAHSGVDAVPGRSAEPVHSGVDAMSGRSAEPAPGNADAVSRTVVDLDERRRKRGNRGWGRLVAPIGIAAAVAGLAGYGLFASTDAAQEDKASTAAAGAPEPMLAASMPAPTTSGLDYTLGTLGQSVMNADAAGTPKSLPELSGPELSGPESTGLERLTAPGALGDCLAEIARENAGGRMTVTSIDYARFEGEPALVVRFAASNGEWAWASGADCGLPGGGADTLGSVPVR
ncbi:hypothetical protein Acy02nite_45630 [Actinoplanes cyaneus]|uniref:Anti-sigma factor n=1 Tax=Actinoplanes cyaneus TaxID=52696 RepID=A0A919M5H4_9ACTN|nr:hypothetical protein [Actinoplanes cyaneus]MCW2138975.1 hypothetical protein [Actinoplanes cyaneus]GID66682.1 hypothetical protein Acy02nite_45630 [Actinoplanes cyaneus]